MAEIKGKNILVLGAGASGRAAAILARSRGAFPVILDTGNPDTAELVKEGIEIITGKNAAHWQGSPDLVIFSPGIPVDSPLGRLGTSFGCPVMSELGFGASFITCPILAVTGTNGKTTTVEMLEHCLKNAGYTALAAGNIGLPMSEAAMLKENFRFIAAEVSSFQLEHTEGFSPAAAAILNITPDHLSRHGSMEAYTAAKMNILRCGKPMKPVLNKNLQNLSPDCITFSADPLTGADFTVRDKCLVRNNNGTSILVDVNELPFKGSHNYENALAALALLETAGLNPMELAQHLKSFRTGAHRLETAAARDNLIFIDDSKATNADALIKALDTLKTQHRPIALIAGGVDKGCSLTEVLPALAGTVQSVFLIGSCRGRLAAAWGSTLPAIPCSSMDEAVTKAADSLAGDGIVLLSPACASQDMYRDYAHRGDDFRNAANNYLGQNQIEIQAP